MAFDAGMLAASADEIRTCLCGCKIEKIHGPSRDEVLIAFRPSFDKEGGRLLICVGANSPRVQMTHAEISNPPQPPSFVLLLRKHLSGARLVNVSQPGFERVVEFEFEARDELEFRTSRTLVAEIMGKYSNLMLLDRDRRIIAAVKTVDLTTSHKRQVIPGMIYEYPPAQDKSDPLTETRGGFHEKFLKNETAADKFILNNYKGVSPLVSREIAYGCGGGEDTLWNSFCDFVKRIEERRFEPVLVRDPDGKPCEYCFMPVRQYGRSFPCETLSSFADLLDAYFSERGRSDRIRQRAHDLHKLIENSEARLARKIEALRADVAACAEKDEIKKTGDLINSNLHAIPRGSARVTLTDYYDESMPEITVTLDPRLTPAQNAQKYYKKYAKLKNGEKELAVQLEKAVAELDYIKSVDDEFSRAETESDISEIKHELYGAGYGQRMKNYSPSKQKESKPLKFVTSGGYVVLCGRNNIQNDVLTHRTASRGDCWFHVKKAHGSHAVMICDGLPEPDVSDFTQAAMIAAYYSEKRNGKNVEVDYTQVKNLKKPAGSKPGFVIYNTNYSAVVNPDGEAVLAMKVKQQ